MSNNDYIQSFLFKVRGICDSVSLQSIDRAIEILFQAWKDQRTIFVMGNGGSASTATHFTADLTQVTWDLSPRIRAMSLSDNVPLVSALINDRGWDNLYIEQLKTFAKPGDIGIGISVHGGSGSDKAGKWSQNLLKGLQYIKDNGGPTIGLIGFDGGSMKNLVDAPIIVPANLTPLVEGFHVVLHHLIAACLKEKIQNYNGLNSEREHKTSLSTAIKQGKNKKLAKI